MNGKFMPTPEGIAQAIAQSEVMDFWEQRIDWARQDEIETQNCERLVIWALWQAIKDSPQLYDQTIKEALITATLNHLDNSIG